MDDWSSPMREVLTAAKHFGVIHNPTQPVSNLCTVFSQGDVTYIPTTLLGSC